MAGNQADAEIQAIVDQTLAFVQANNEDPRTWVGMERLSQRWQSSSIRAVVVGEVSRGKSTMINALVGRRLLPAAVKALTSAWTHLRYGRALAAVALIRDGAETEYAAVNRLEDLKVYLTVDGVARFASLHSRTAEVVSVEIEVPAPLLASGLEIIDTPGVGGQVAAHRHTTLAAVSESDAVLFVIKPNEPITASERMFLAEAVDRVSCCVVVQTHRDQTLDASSYLDQDMAKLRDADEWARVTGDPERGKHLARRFHDVKAVSISAANYLKAMEIEDPILAQETRDASGLNLLIEIIESDVVGRSLTLHRLNILRLAELATEAIAARMRERIAMFSGDVAAAAAIEERERRIARWVEHNGDRWRREYNAAIAEIDEQIRHVARTRVDELEREHLYAFSRMSAKQLTEQMDLLVKAPAAALAEMNSVLKNNLTAAVAQVRGLLEQDRLGEPLNRLEGTKIAFSRLDKRRQQEALRLEFDDVKAGVTGGMAGVGFAAAGLLALQHGGFIAAAAAAAPVAPIVLPFVVGAGVFIAINQWRKRKAQTLAAAKETFAAVKASILNDAVEAVRAAASRASTSIAAEIEAGLKELGDQTARDRADLEAATKLSAAERLDLVGQAEDVLEEAERLRGRIEQARANV